MCFLITTTLTIFSIDHGLLSDTNLLSVQMSNITAQLFTLIYYLTELWR